MSAELTPKEEEVMKMAWRCLKSGPPEIDIEKLKVMGNFNTTKTASNYWGVIKKKLMTETGNTIPAAPNKAAGEPATPRAKKGTAVPVSGKKRSKKAAAADDSDDSDYAISLNRKKAKTPVKKDQLSFNFGGEEA